MRRALIPFGAPALAYALGATLSLGCFSGCFSGGFLAGVPCESDVECGPSLACFEGVCGGHDAQVPDLPPPPSDLPDPGSDSDSETDTEPGPDALELRDDDYETLMEATLTVLPGDEDAPLANDGAPPGEPYAMIPAELETSAGGAASVTGAGGLSYAPAPFFWGCDAFTYSAQDDRGAAGSATVRVTVRPTAAALTGAAAQGHGAELVGDPEVTGAGASVAFAGDVNGDGLDDLVIGALVRDAIPARVRVYVVFGREDWALPTLAELAADGGESASGGFLIIGEPTFLSGSDPHPPAVASAGDVNGDGLDDLLIGLDNAKGDVLGSGRAYVVFGKPDAAPVLLEEVGGPVGVGGFALNAHKNDERAGADVAALGDLNADGFDDLVIGAPDTDELYATGRVYVVFGKPTTGLVSLEDTPGSGRGFWIDGPLADAEDIGVDQGDFGAAVANAGDFNGDGVNDVVIGAPWTVGGGRAYVVYGRDDATTLDAATLGSDGVTLTGPPGEGSVGVSVAGAGDLNGDGRGDVLVGAPGAGGGAGRVYVVYGTDEVSELELDAIATLGRGFVIEPATPSEQAGLRVTAAGDVNDDAVPDLLLGSPGFGATSAGRAYVLHGRADAGAVSLTAVASGDGGFALHGGPYEAAGAALSGAGDLDGDGYPELLIGAPEQGAATTGRVYVISTAPCGPPG